jgi:hypothetical protein
MNDQDMFNEAIRVGNLNAAQANRYMTVARLLYEGVDAALKHLASGQPEIARTVLQLAQKRVAKKVATGFSTPDLTEAVAKAIADMRAQNGMAPYEGWHAIPSKEDAEILREQLFKEARAAMAALGIR